MPLIVPKYRELPIAPHAPAGSAWGVFDKDGKRDVYGTLNFVTGEAVVNAKQEIQTGESVVLKCNFWLFLTCVTSRLMLVSVFRSTYHTTHAEVVLNPNTPFSKELMAWPVVMMS